MRKTPLNKIGKIGKANTEASKIIRKILEGGEIGYCEMKLEGCMGNWPLQVAHRHKRSWYKGDVAKLADPQEWVIACQVCHNKTEYNRELNDEIFNKLRP